MHHKQLRYFHTGGHAFMDVSFFKELYITCLFFGSWRRVPVMSYSKAADGNVLLGIPDYAGNNL